MIGENGNPIQNAKSKSISPIKRPLAIAPIRPIEASGGINDKFFPEANKQVKVKQDPNYLGITNNNTESQIKPVKAPPVKAPPVEVPSGNKWYQ